MEDRARAAAQSSRAKTGDSDALRQNYVTPGLSGQPIRTVDNSKSFNPQISCQKTATLMEVLVQPSSGGDLGGVQIARDTNLDGTIDTRTSLPVPVSGICANGVISCAPGSWDQCRYFRWMAEGSRTLKLAEVAISDLAGCYCINNSCGANLAWSNMPSLLRDLGGGMIGALTTADPRFGVAEAVIDGPMIRYVGAQSSACAGDQTLPQTSYRDSPASLAGDAFAASASNPVFEMLSSSPVGLGTAQQVRHCTIERRVTVTRKPPEDVVSGAGGYAIERNGNSLDFYLGSPGDRSIAGHGCTLTDFRMTIHVGDPAGIVDARLAQLSGDDWAQLRIDGVLVASGEDPWTSLGNPPGSCEKGRTFFAYPNLDLKPMLGSGDHEIWLRIATADHGDGYAQIHVQLNDGCRTTEQVVDACAPIAQDPKCRIDSEMVDGVQTFRNGINTGLRPLSQTRQMGDSICPVDLTRDFFQKDRTYRCDADSTAMPQPDLSRGAYILDHSTETLLADRVQRPDGSFAESTRPFALPDRGSVPACEPICKTRAPSINNAAAPAGVVGNQQNQPASFDTFYHTCGTDNVCPVGSGEEMVSACGCLNDFPEAVVMMQTVRLAGADLVCTATKQ